MKIRIKGRVYEDSKESPGLFRVEGATVRMVRGSEGMLWVAHRLNYGDVLSRACRSPAGALKSLNASFERERATLAR